MALPSAATGAPNQGRVFFAHVEVQPTSPVTLNSCSVRDEGGAIAYSLRFRSLQRLKSIRLELIFYDQNQQRVVSDTYLRPLKVHGSGTLNVFKHTELLGYNDVHMAARYVLCSISDVELASGQSWSQQPVDSPVLWSDGKSKN